MKSPDEYGASRGRLSWAFAQGSEPMTQDEIQLTRGEQTLQAFFLRGRTGVPREYRRAARYSPVLGLDGGK
ncbi:hypothetical protein IFM12276_59160 [Nocardia sputorum]|uniref:Uncharacterized protein n=1 Tax=Nocardia sputorum TaxID=2984338 RepID=A0ABN6UCQ6_9NOCA|nr:hypothetical protein IFM12276_59160 [Nocardia sputorum]